MSIDLDHRGLIRVNREHCISEIISLLLLINVNIFTSFISFRKAFKLKKNVTFVSLRLTP